MTLITTVLRGLTVDETLGPRKLFGHADREALSAAVVDGVFRAIDIESRLAAVHHGIAHRVDFQVEGLHLAVHRRKRFDPVERSSVLKRE